MCDRRLFRVSTIAHRAELVHSKAPSAEAEPVAGKENRSARIELYQDRQEHKKWRGERQAYRGDDDVHHPLENNELERLGSHRAGRRLEAGSLARAPGDDVLSIVALGQNILNGTG
ncbi:MAG: hypothetical protein JWL61_280 [Gemmatimonadetes bacterium]|nr:hypothetical protein [Gemmatimonadota bacterium]